MTTITDRPSVRAPTPTGSTDTNETRSTQTPAEQLRSAMTAVRLSISWLGVRKSLTRDQKQQAADTFGAEGQYLSAAKKLLDTKHPAYQAVTSVKGKAAAYWKGMTLPYPDPGVRLLRQDQIETFNTHLLDFRGQLDEAVTQLDQHYAELKVTARDRLGSLFNESDYPARVTGMFTIDWDFPSVEPPDYLRQLCPDLWRRECQRVTQRFDEAVELAEQAFMDEFGKLVSHITERLDGTQNEDGKPKVFRDSAVTNLHAFFERFRQLNIHSNEQLDALVDRAQQAVTGVVATDLRTSSGLRQRVADQLSQVKQSLDELLVDRPRRRILRSSQREEA